mmetsp:Transcript_958/g.1963  ORF Transcript_958/g.1963 Transcript_958/m.1963 type:complete len:85 (-) Transcript_958:350-604(-)
MQRPLRHPGRAFSMLSFSVPVADCMIPGRARQLEQWQQVAHMHLSIDVAHSVTLRVSLDVFNLLLKRDHSVETMETAFMAHTLR